MSCNNGIIYLNNIGSEQLLLCFVLSVQMCQSEVVTIDK